MTYYNEKPSVVRFFEELRTWTRLPDEIVMVDGGSTDGTVEAVRAQIPTCPAPVELLATAGCNISEGRNTAIRNARHDLIAITDMGCTIAPDWLEKILAPFDDDPSVEVVGGYYEATGDAPLQKCFADLLYKPHLSKKSFLPSSRSLALKRHVWEAVGGYPEAMTVAEDTEFDLRIRRMGFHEIFAPDAKVYWNVKTRYRGYFYQYFRYARSAGYIMQAPLRYGFTIAMYATLLLWLVLTLAAHPAFALLALVQVIAYAWLRIFRKPRAREHMSIGNLWRYAMLVLTTDLATIVGYLAGLPNALLGRREPWAPPADR
jgi:GT2 family glycosyltransferase